MKGKTLKNNKEANKYCSVFGCKNKISEEISLHKLPDKDPERREKWIRILKMAKVPKNTFVCSNHFTKDDFFFPDIPNKKRNLKRSAIPSQNLPQTNVDKYIEHQKMQRNGAAEERRRRYVLRDVKNTLGSEIEVGSNSDPSSENLHATDNIRNCDQNKIQMECDYEYKENKEPCEPSFLIEERPVLINGNPYAEEQNTGNFDHSYCLQSPSRDIGIQCCEANTKVDIGIQVTPSMINEKPFRIPDVIDTNRKLNTCTGIQDFHVLEAIEKNIATVKNKLNLKTKNHALELKHIIILILMRLKLNVSFAFLSVLFSVSPTACRSYFDEFLGSLSFVFRSVIIWPSKIEVLQTMPTCFSLYRKTRVVIDCTECPVEKPKCLACAIKIYSYYKSGETIKFLLGVSPSGLITFISEPYGGRASDKAITVQSDLFSKIDPFEAIMADKGFLIEEECDSNFIHLIRPPFLRKKNQFSRAEAESTRSVAAARVNVERSIQRIKIFKILKTKFPFRRINQIEDIMIIIAGLVNLSDPILGDDKFLMFKK